MLLVQSSLIKILCLEFCIIASLSFNKLYAQNNDSSILKECNIYGNYAIKEADAKRYIDNFNKTYRQKLDDINTLKEFFSVDSCYIVAFAAYLENEGKTCDGFRFVFGTDRRKKNNEVMLIVPTVLVINKKHIKHKNLWNFKMHFSDCETSKAEDLSLHKKLVRRYKRHHRKDPFIGKPKRDNLSKSVWFEKCVMEFIRDTIKNQPAHLLYGINVYNAAYSEIMDNIPSQSYCNQSTTVITFTKRNSQGQIVSDFGFGEGLYNEFKRLLDAKLLEAKDFKRKFDDSLNHGELCPKNCPPAGN